VLVSNISDKVNIFNNFFATQCSLINTGSIFPPDNFTTDLRLDTIIFDEAKILAFICAPNVNKAHGWDEISIRMIKICDEFLVVSYENISIFTEYP